MGRSSRFFFLEGQQAWFCTFWICDGKSISKWWCSGELDRGLWSPRDVTSLLKLHWVGTGCSSSWRMSWSLGDLEGSASERVSKRPEELAYDELQNRKSHLSFFHPFICPFSFSDSRNQSSSCTTSVSLGENNNLLGKGPWECGYVW